MFKSRTLKLIKDADTVYCNTSGVGKRPQDNDNMKYFKVNQKKSTLINNGHTVDYCVPQDIYDVSATYDTIDKPNDNNIMKLITVDKTNHILNNDLNVIGGNKNYLYGPQNVSDESLNRDLAKSVKYSPKHCYTGGFNEIGNCTVNIIDSAERSESNVINEYARNYCGTRDIYDVSASFHKIGGETAERFRNRKGYFSLNVQVICNADLEVMDVVARYDGSTHDSRIFRECKRRALFEQGVYGDAVLVGDSGYASARYMMTPLQECHTPGENLYNESQIRTRNVERFFGVWKQRFPVMAMGLRVKLERVFPIITATLVLHNIARRAGEEVPFGFEMTLPAPWEEILAQDNIQIDYVPNPTNQRTTQNSQRQALIDNHFERLVTDQQ